MKPCFLIDDRFQDATPTVTPAAAADFPIENLADSRTFQVWQSGSVAISQITVEAADAADTIGIANHNLAGLECKVQKSDDAGATWPTQLTFTPADNRPILLAVPTAAATFGWRLEIEAGTDAHYIGVLRLGERLQMPRFPVGDFTPELINAKKIKTTSKAGHNLGTLIQYTEIKIKGKFKYVDTAWFHATLEPFLDDNAAAQLFFGWDLENWPKKVIYGELGDKQAPRYGKTPGVEVNIEMTGTR